MVKTVNFLHDFERLFWVLCLFCSLNWTSKQNPKEIFAQDHPHDPPLWTCVYKSWTFVPWSCKTWQIKKEQNWQPKDESEFWCQKSVFEEIWVKCDPQLTCDDLTFSTRYQGSEVFINRGLSSIESLVIRQNAASPLPRRRRCLSRCYLSASQEAVFWQWEL